MRPLLVLLLVLAIWFACSRSKHSAADAPESFVGNTAAQYSEQSLEMTLNRAVQVAKLQIATPVVQMTNPEAQTTVDASMPIILQRTGLRLTVISVTSATKQVASPDQVTAITLIVYDKSRNALYSITIGTLEDLVTREVRLYQCSMTSKVSTSRFQGVSVPGWKYEVAPVGQA